MTTDQTAHPPAIDPWMRAILRCPACTGTLTDGTAPDGTAELACDGCDRAYPVLDGIPVLLVDEARRRPAGA